MDFSPVEYFQSYLWLIPVIHALIIPASQAFSYAINPDAWETPEMVLL